MTILFSNSSPKIPKSGIFGSKFKDFYFCTKLCYKTNSRTLISDMTIFQPKNTQIRNFWSQLQAFLFFHEILQLDKFEGADFKYNKIIFKSQPKNNQIRHFGFKFNDSYFCTKLCNKTNSRTLIKIFVVKNIQIRHFWSQIQEFLFLC